MLRRKNPGSSRIETLIGRSVRVRGDLEFSGGLHLDGCVTGHVQAAPGVAAALSVSEHACIDGSIEAPSVSTNGVVRGDIRARGRVVLGPRARVEGDVYYGLIEMAPGAEIRGRLVPHEPAAGARDEAAEPGGPF